MPSNVKFADVVVELVLLLNKTLFAVPTTLVAVVDVVEFPLSAPENVTHDRVFVDALKV